MDSKHYAGLTAHQIADGVRTKKFTAVEVVDAALTLAHALDPKIKAFMTILDDRARAAAVAVDADVAAGKPLKLAGVPVALKDNLCVTGTRTTCSSKILDKYVPPYTGTAVQRILDEGGIPIGKTNLDEFAMGSSTENSAMQTTRNPWDTDRIPGGSSGGSAAALAAGFCHASLGSDTGGSIRQPAALCGLVGLKPTYGRVSRYGLIAFASSLDQIGPFATTVADAATVLEVMSGHDPADSTSIPEASPSLVDQLDRGVDGLRIGLVSELTEADGIEYEVSDRVREAAAALEKAGAVVE